MEKIKLIWDFRGADAHQIAEHHVKHLKEYATANGLNENATGVEKMSPLYSLAFFVVEKQNMRVVRDALRPHRGEYVE
ncbi:MULTISPECIES: hypothetical protein [unclassified Leeuwenhoekiella]|uniref:hypothetical protein n=1 Tax=unclassified Leeuwenhoekiella TaxID=2615029 RepID=UPI0025B8F588|nr:MULTISPECIES: hypothetical protein [unclassified Leeuwenhoekiella]|tara:strand:+ start:2559 stop:2792 length:234 start_codon:yes stop_codon:yes gene_type:complete